MKLRNHLSAPGLFSTIRRAFSKVEDQRDKARVDFTLADSLMSGVAIFSMKYPSLLQFDRGKTDPTIANNLRTLYGIEKAPSDTQLRKILDPLDPDELRPAFKAVFAKLQDGKELQPLRFIDESYLLSIDGTGYFSSHDVHCDNCCEKKSSDGSITYYHQMLGAVIVHPQVKQVIPLVPEAIIKKDGSNKNDCERNAIKRLIPALRKDHPFLKITLLGDGLFSNGPMIQLATEHKMGFIFGAKPGDHASLYNFVEDAKSIGAVEFLEVEENGIVHRFEFINEVPLNDSNEELMVNFLRYSETKKEKTTTFSWVTSIFLHKNNVYQVMRGGRSRWRIENEVFNTLKNQGYQFEHNFGHGEKNLSTVFAYLMLLAFLIDQIQELSCPVFQALFKKAGQRKYMWERIRSFLLMITCSDWQFVFDCLLNGYQTSVIPNST